MTKSKKNKNKKAEDIKINNEEVSDLVFNSKENTLQAKIYSKQPMVRIKVNSTSPDVFLPEKAYDSDAAYDIRACISKNSKIINATKTNALGREVFLTQKKNPKTSIWEIHIYKNERIAIPTGIISDIPDGFCAKIYPRSGLSLHKGVIMVNSPGIIDSKYRGEWHVILQNIGEKPVVIKNRDRIAQVMFEPVAYLDIERVSQINKDTERGEGGFGSTGK